MQPPARSSQSAPDPLALLAPAQPSGSQNPNLFFAFLGQGLSYGVTGGAGWGALYGALFGTLIMPGIGTILGAISGPVIGLVFGTVAGFVGGIALGLLTLLYFAPLCSARGYRLAIGLLGTFTTALLGLLAIRLLVPGPWKLSSLIEILKHEAAGFLGIPTLIAVGYAWWATGRLADWYARSPISQAARPPRVQAAQIAHNIYHPDFLRQLFDEMQNTYELVSNITSFGFNHRWRAQLLRLLDLRPGMRICDAMCGSGETWRYILPRISPTGSLAAVDFSSVMARQARERRRGLPGRTIEVFEEDALQMPLANASVDALICVYGVKTLSNADQERFVLETRRVLKVGGAFGLVEVSAPRRGLLRSVYMFYLRYIVPPIGWLLLGNPENYRMLSRYVADFGSCRQLSRLFADAGFAVHEYSFFGDCATALVGMKLDKP